MLLIPCVSSIELIKENNNSDITLTLNVEKKRLGWHITTTLENNGNDWIFVEKDGYGDIGCVIYNEEDNKVWYTYDPDSGSTWQIGPGATYESFTIWTGADMDKNELPKGTYKIVGKAGYFEGDEYIPLETNPDFAEVAKAKTKNIFLNNIYVFINKFLNTILPF
jgi:hypothetical protein